MAETKTFRARMLAFADPQPDGNPAIREIDVPIDWLCDHPLDDLETIYYFGQNDCQPKPICSVSVGDVVEYGDELYVVAPCGFKKLTEDQYGTLLAMDQRDRHFNELVRP